MTGYSCMQTSTPDWVFSLTLASGMVAVVTGLSWGILLTRPRPLSAPVAPSTWSHIWRVLQVALLGGWTVFLGRAPFAMFWLLPPVTVLAIVTCGSSVYAQITSMVPC